MYSFKQELLLYHFLGQCPGQEVPRTRSGPGWGHSGFVYLGEVVMSNRTRKVNTGQIIELLRDNLCGPAGKRPRRSLTGSEQERQKASQEAGPGDGMGT